MENRIYDIAAQKVSNQQLSLDDEKFLSNWLKEDGNNQVFDEILKTWDLTAELDLQLDVDVEAEWKTFQDNKTAKNVKKTKVIRLRTIVSAVAASVLIAVAYFQFLQKPDFETFYASGEKQLKVLLPDSSVVWLHSHSSLELDNNFGKRKRKMKLAGEAFFDVKPNKEKPFVVKTFSGVKARVLGTSFNIRAFENEKNIELQVVSGKVAFGKGRIKNQPKLVKGQQIAFNKDKKTLSSIKKVENNMLSWRTHKFKFDGTSFDEVAKSMSRYYNCPVVFPASSKKMSYTGEFEKPSKEYFGEIMALSNGWECVVNKNGIRFYEKN